VERSSYGLIEVLSQHLPEGTEENHDDDYDDGDSDGSLSSLQLYDMAGSCWFILALNLGQPTVYWPSKTSVASEYDNLLC
jgi:hypothetical protein